MLWLKALLLLVAGLSNVLVGMLVLLRGPKRINNVSFFGLAVSIGGWAIGIAFFLLTTEPSLAFWWAKIYYLFPLIISIAVVVFAEAWPDKSRIRLRWLIPATLAFLALAGPLILSPTFLTDHIVTHPWGKEVVLNKTEYLLYSLYIVPCYLLSLLAIYRKGESERRLQAAQAKVFSIGFSVALVFGVIFNLILPWLGNYQLIWIGPLFTSAFIVAIAYSIVKHQMFDIHLVVARLLAYSLSIFLLLGGYALISYVGINIVSAALDNAYRTVANLVLIAVAAASYAPLLKYFNRVSNKIFYHDAYDPQAFIDKVNQALVTNIELDKLLKEVAQVMADNFKADYCVFGIKETKFHGQRVIGTAQKSFDSHEVALVRSITPAFSDHAIVADFLSPKQKALKQLLDKNGIAVLVRIAPVTKLPEEGVGYMVLGTKRSGNLYSGQDMQMLEIFAKELLIAIQNALHFDEIKQFNITLQEEVDNATRKLRRTNRRLEELDDIKDDFISMASHQLRTPLTSVKGYLSMVLEGDAGTLNEMQGQMLKQAFTSSQRMVFLITDLLNVSRLKTGKFVIDAAPANLDEIIKQELEQLHDVVQAKGVELSYDRPASFPMLMLDDVKIRQVIMNFVDNAIYYTPAGGHIQVELTEKNATVEVRVIDDGIGVPKSEQHHLFTKFYRATNARRARPDGTGLGLFMAQKVIVAEGGSVIFSSQEGKGSIFGFSLPKNKLAILEAKPSEKSPAKAPVAAK